MPTSRHALVRSLSGAGYQRPLAGRDGQGLTYVRTFPSSITAPVQGVEEGEVEYEIAREQWKRRVAWRRGGQNEPTIQSGVSRQTGTAVSCEFPEGLTTWLSRGTTWFVPWRGVDVAQIAIGIPEFPVPVLRPTEPGRPPFGNRKLTDRDPGGRDVGSVGISVGKA